MTKALVEPRGDAEPLEPALTRSLRLEVLSLLETFSWLLERYHRLADPSSHYTAQHVYETMKQEANRDMSLQEAEAYVYQMRNLSLALANAVDEWREGKVP